MRVNYLLGTIFDIGARHPCTDSVAAGPYCSEAGSESDRCRTGRCRTVPAG